MNDRERRFGQRHRSREVARPCRASVLAALMGVMAFASAGVARAEPVQQRIGDRMYRVWSGPGAEADANPSLALDGPWPSLGAPTQALPLEPVFTPLGAQFRVTFDAPAGAAFYATGSVPGPLLRNGRRTVCWNTDAYAWSDSTESLYESHPWVMMVRADGSAVGVLADTTYRCEIDLTGSLGPEADIAFTADTYDFPVILIERQSPQLLMTALAELTGHPPMPPLWALGYHQCRYQYAPQSTVLSIAQEFRARSIPCDVVWVDIGYMDAFRTFTFDPVDFPDPIGLNASLDAIGFSAIWTSNPGAPPDPSFFLYAEGVAGDHFVKSPDAITDYTGPMWPGAYRWADFTRGATRAWWANTVATFVGDHDVDGVWVDMNEPAVFVGSKTMPLANVHRADAALGGTDTHDRYHNVYGMLQAQATREGVLQAYPDRRPFVLTRANYLGGHRYAAVWSGDNNADEYHYRVSIPNILNLGLSGQPFSGPDIGGFNGSIDAGLFERWMAVGALFPFSRGHTGNSQQKEPWAFGAGVEDTARRALNRRYRLLPHLYTAFHQAHTGGQPVMRPLFFANPADPQLRAIDDTFLLGDGLIVSIATEGSTPCDTPGPNFPIPAGATLHRLGFPVTNNPVSPSDLSDPVLPEMYVLGGSIIPAGPIRQTTAGYELDPLTLIVALDDSGVATGVLYEDDNDGFEYQGGDFLKTTYLATRNGTTVTVAPLVEEGGRPRPSRELNVRMLLPDGSEVFAEGIDGQPIQIEAPLPAQAPATLGTRAAEDIDGCDIPSAFGNTPLATQIQPARWGDNVNELNALFAAQEPDAIRIGITGNLDLSATALALFIDTKPGGQSVVDTSTLNPPPGGLQQLTGTSFDPGFEPDTLLFMNAFGGTLYVDQATLPAGAPAIKTFRGSVGVDSGQSLLTNGENPNGLRIALSNANFLGVTALDATTPASADHGFEMRIPFADLALTDDDCQRVRVMAMLVSSGGTVSTQVLPPVGVEANDLGEAPSFGAIDGLQFATLALSNVMDFDADGDVDVLDFAGFLGAFGSIVEPGSKGDANADGSVDVLDFAEFLARFGCGG